MRWLGDAATVVALGPLWMGAAREGTVLTAGAAHTVAVRPAAAWGH